jgi:hypothetical protein
VAAAQPTPFTVRDNLMSFIGDIRPCEVNVYVGTPIDTSGWQLEDLDRTRQQVRQRIVAMHEMWKAG